MFTQIKNSFEEGAAGINVVCKNCGKLNFVGTSAASAISTCRYCGARIELSNSNKESLRWMIAQKNRLG